MYIPMKESCIQSHFVSSLMSKFCSRICQLCNRKLCDIEANTVS
uniref:Uncharacterized protein n=1 Tax=Arundo donax TaxID=35708 RepID=A0A0A8ZNG5_ARUDO